MNCYYGIGLILFMTSMLTSLNGSPTGEFLTDLANESKKLPQEQSVRVVNYNHKPNGGNYVRYPQSFSHLRNKIDRLNLRQKIDRILIQNLQKSVKNFEKLFESRTFQKESRKMSRKSKKESRFHKLKRNEDKNFEKNDLKFFQNSERKSQINFSKSSPLEFESIQIQILDKLHLHIKEEVEKEMKNARSKITAMENCCKKCDDSLNARVYDDSAVKWLLQVVPNLQKNVKDLQESTSVVQAMHDKQDLDSRLSAVGRDIVALQKGRSALATEVESAIASTVTLAADVRDAAPRIHKLEGSFVHVKEQLGEQKSALDDLLKALPDGFLVDGLPPSKPHRPTQPNDHPRDSLETHGTIFAIEETGNQESLSANTEGRSEREELNARLEKLELRTTSLDFSLMNLQKKVENLRQNTITTQSNPTLQESISPMVRDRELSTRFREIEFELSKLKDSSESFLKVISTIENGNENSLKEVSQKLSKVETQIDQEREERQSKNDETRTNFLETKKEVRDDYVELKNDVSFLKKQLITLMDKSKPIDENALGINTSSSCLYKSHKFFDERYLKSKVNEVCRKTLKIENEKYQRRLLNLENLYEIVRNNVLKNTKVLAKKMRHKHGLGFKS